MADTTPAHDEIARFDLTQNPFDRAEPRALWQRVQSAVVGKGIEIVCGRDATVDARVATQIPVVPAALRMAWLRALGLAGLRTFVTRSGLGYDFVCHIGDMAEFPFYHRGAYAFELKLCAAWLQDAERPLVYDIGANTGFVSGHLAQMLAKRRPRIYAFEPVPTTFDKLIHGVQRLGLADRVFPMRLAIADKSGPVRLSYSDRRSLLAQMTPAGLNPRVGDSLAEAEAMSLDHFCLPCREVPHLVKIDVEGSEASVLRGASSLLSRRDRPAILFEYNPVTLTECGVAISELASLLRDYSLFYVDDLSGQRMPFATAVPSLEKVDWICNLFAVPTNEESAARWRNALARLRSDETSRG